MDNKMVLIIGGGVAGLSSALVLAKNRVKSLIVEKTPYLGGYAAQYTCKAANACVKCGACIVDEKMQEVIDSPHIEILTESQIWKVTRNGRFAIEIEQQQDAGSNRIAREADAIIMATGFKPFDPAGKPYGYEEFNNVITSLELECMLREKSVATRPSDKKAPQNIAFFQCVGSRDASLGHLWCSKVCCASALRMSRLIKMRQPDIDITFFYIDVQTFGKEFSEFYTDVKNQVNMVRAIPGDIYPVENERLKINYYDARNRKSCEDVFDLVVLSIGITPAQDNLRLAESLKLRTEDGGFVSPGEPGPSTTPPGVFAAGTACGPMTIAESIASAGSAAMAATVYLGKLDT